MKKPIRQLLSAAIVAVAGFGAAPAAIAQDAQFTAEQLREFEVWRNQFRIKALAAGIKPAVFYSAFAGLSPNPKILNFDRKQPEFSRPIWKYLESAVSASRVKNGREKKAELAGLLPRLQQAYGVDPNVVLGIWGLESAYGHAYGDFSIIRSLATLAFDGRRRKFAEEQLIAALKILENGDVTPENLLGSWAGAMGHVQFIPTSYHSYAVDFTGDGRRDLWSDDPSDALASAANYLARSGWRMGQPSYLPVRLPAGVDYFPLESKNKQPAQVWRDMGITLMNGAPVPNFGPAAVIVPAGARGPAFMVFHNFGVIKKYNNADSYALGVAHLGERIAGAGPMNLSWPTDDAPLGRSTKKTLQTSLTQLGFDTKGVDGKFGPDSRTALRGFQRSRGLPADGYASKKILERVTAAVEGREGLNRNQIQMIQLRLNERGFNAGGADGLIGPQTRAAIRAFQQAAGYVVDGQPSAALLQALALGN